jgi:hypothetical protein
LRNSWEIVAFSKAKRPKPARNYAGTDNAVCTTSVEQWFLWHEQEGSGVLIRSSCTNLVGEPILLSTRTLACAYENRDLANNV